MWYLIMVLLNPAPGFANITFLDKSNPFASEALCLVERHRVGYAMAEAYPSDSEDFRIECKGPPEAPKNLRVEQ